MNQTNPRAAIYARVSSEQQAQEHTIAGQVEGLRRLPSESRVVVSILEWYVLENNSLSQICNRLDKEGILKRSGRPSWDPTPVWDILREPRGGRPSAQGRRSADVGPHHRGRSSSGNCPAPSRDRWHPLRQLSARAFGDHMTARRVRRECGASCRPTHRPHGRRLAAVGLHQFE
jgi:hypothetical protein